MGNDLLYNLLGAGIVAIVGFALIMKAGNKLGWLLVAGACLYGFVALKPTIESARRSSAAQGGTTSNYYKTGR